MNVCVIGTGHVGLVTCVTMQAIGHDVVGLDCDAEKIGKLTNGQSPFFEPGVEELLVQGLAAGKLSFTTDPAEALRDADVVFVCVGTPSREDGTANLQYVEEAGQTIARNVQRRAVVVEKSTVPAGTSERLRRLFMRERQAIELELEIVSNPEFLREGRAVRDSLEPDRILLGAESPWALEVMRELYQPLLDQGAPLVETDITTAELAKHACNAFLSLKISFSNALARLCEHAGADVVDIADVMGLDSRIGRDFLNAGLGYGGYCFPKDVAALERLSSDLGYDFPLMREIARINDEAVTTAVDKIRGAIWNLEGKRIALLGLAFKGGTDDIRLSPALQLARRLIAEGADVVGFDPEAMPEVKRELPEIELAGDEYAAATNADCLVIATDWHQFAHLDYKLLDEIMRDRVILDGRNMLDPATVREQGFEYHGMGRGRATV